MKTVAVFPVCRTSADLIIVQKESASKTRSNFRCSQYDPSKSKSAFFQSHSIQFSFSHTRLHIFFVILLFLFIIIIFSFASFSFHQDNNRSGRGGRLRSPHSTKFEWPIRHHFAEFFPLTSPSTTNSTISFPAPGPCTQARILFTVGINWIFTTNFEPKLSTTFLLNSSSSSPSSGSSSAARRLRTAARVPRSACMGMSAAGRAR